MEVDKYRNEEERKQARKLEIADVEEQIKRSEEYLKRMKNKLKELKMICPVCNSWDKDIREDYDVEYRGLKGKCLNPICKAEWNIKIPKKEKE